MKESKTPPPLPPKPDHSVLRGQLAAADGTGDPLSVAPTACASLLALHRLFFSSTEVGHHARASVPVSIPTVPQLRPVLEAISRGSSPIPPDQVLVFTVTSQL